MTRALGIEPDVQADSWLQPIVKGDPCILCSDGLVDEVDDDDITSIVATNTDPQSCTKATRVHDSPRSSRGSSDGPIGMTTWSPAIQSWFAEEQKRITDHRIRGQPTVIVKEIR